MKYDIMVIGTHCGNDIVMAEHLAGLGLKSCVARRPEDNSTVEVPAEYLKHFSRKDVVVTKTRLDFVRLAHECRMIVSITGGLIHLLGKLWPAHRFLGLPPVVALITGSDFLELSLEKSMDGAFYRQYLKFADINWILPYPHALQNILKLNVKNVVFMPGFPFIVPDVPPEFQNPNRLPHGKRLRFFHCSVLDFNYTWYGEQRVSSKSNDRFIRAFARAVRDGYDIDCVILYRGHDRDVAKEMVRRAGPEVSSRFIWKNELNREELFQEFLNSDVIVNLFSCGGIGGITIEAMTLGCPMMQFGSKTYYDLAYAGVQPPYINCRTEDEIYDKIVWCCKNPEKLNDVAAEGKKWVEKYIAPQNSMKKFLFYYSALTGDRKLDFGPFIGEMEEHVKQMKAGTYDPFKGLCEPE